MTTSPTYYPLRNALILKVCSPKFSRSGFALCAPSQGMGNKVALLLFLLPKQW